MSFLDGIESVFDWTVGSGQYESQGALGGAFDWLGNWATNNPEIAAGLIQGAAAGAGSYYAAKQKAKSDKDLLEKEIQLQRENKRITPSTLTYNGSLINSDSGLISPKKK